MMEFCDIATLRHCDIAFRREMKYRPGSHEMSERLSSKKAGYMARSDDRHRKFLEEVEQLLREIQKVPMPPTTADQVRFAHQDLLYSIRDLAQRDQLPHDQLQSLDTKIRDYLDLFARRGSLSWEQVEGFPQFWSKKQRSVVSL